MSLPPHSRTYFSRVNIPFGSNNTTQHRMESFWTWALYACLTDQITTGTTAHADPGGAPIAPGTRPSGSVWIVRGASNATSVSVTTAAGVHNASASALWGGGTFPGDFTRGNNTTPHHWMLLENTTLGYELLINFSQSNGFISVSIAPTGTWPVGAGTTSQFPIPSPTTQPVQLGQTAYSSEDHGQLQNFTDTTTSGLTRYCHFTVAPNGEFFFCKSRVGNGNTDSCVGVWRTVNQQAGDNFNTFLFSTGTLSAFSSTRITQFAWAAGLSPTGSQRTSGGNCIPLSFNNIGSQVNVFSVSGPDALTGNHTCLPIEVFDCAPQVAYRGRYPDLYLTNAPTDLSSIPSMSAQVRSTLGRVIVPFVGDAIIA